MKAYSSTVTMKEIAEKAGVSQATVSRVLNNHPSVSPAKRQRVMEWVRKLNFEPNYSAKTLAANSSQLIGVVLPDMQNPYFTEILYHIERIATISGYSILVCNSNGDIQKEKALIRQLKARQVDGLLIGLANPRSEVLESLKRDHIKTVVITQDYEGIDCVAISHKEGGRLAASYLLEGDVSDFAFFGQDSDDKFVGFRDHLLEQGVSPGYIHTIGNHEDWYFSTMKRGYHTLRQFIQTNELHGRLGVFTVSDMYAVTMLQASRELGLRVPEEVSIVGFDNIFLCEAVDPQLTSIAQPVEDIARLALDILFRRIEEKGEPQVYQHIILPSQIIRRGT
jgi:LacI family transcriptional regulator